MTGDDFDTTLRLVSEAQAGDERATDALFSRYLPRIRRIVACRMGRRLLDIAEHEDIVQTAMLRVFQGLERFEARSEASFRHWVAHCVECAIRNAARDAGRLKRGGGAVRRYSEIASDSLSALTFAGDYPTPSAVVSAREMEEAIENALLALPDRYREAIVLRNFCGMTYAEMKEALGVTREATARQIFSRALQRFRELLDE